MHVVLVGRVDAKRVICWRNVTILTIGLAAVMGVGSVIVRWLRAGDWSASSAVTGAFLAVMIVAGGVIRGLQTPLDQLEEVR